LTTTIDLPLLRQHCSDEQTGVNPSAGGDHLMSEVFCLHRSFQQSDSAYREMIASRAIAVPNARPAASSANSDGEARAQARDELQRHETRGADDDHAVDRP
jgi:hypothetical protein